MAETKKFCIHSDGLGYCDILSDDTVHHYCVEGPCPHEIIVEYEPVKHGRWYDIVAFSNGERIIATCSNCKDRGKLRTRRNEWGIWHINSPRCPNCGAKMDLEVTNGLDQH